MRVSLVLDLLDNQVVDADGVPLGRVDDLTVDTGGEDGTAPAVTGVVVAAEALGHRLGGLTGRVMAATTARLRRRGGPPALEVGLFCAVRPMLRITARAPDLDEVAGLEKWLRLHVVARHEGDR